MGLPIKHRKKYQSHKKRWDKQTIVEERDLVDKYALKNKKEIKRAEFMLAKFKKLAKEFNRSEETKSSTQAQNLMNNLKEKGFLPQESESLDDILNINVRDIMERRLSNIVYRLKLARTPSQARQFVVHRHVKVGGKVIDSPSYLVPLNEEATVEFRDTSSLSSEEHPERKIADEGMSVEETKEYEFNDNRVDEDGKSPADRKEEELDDEEVKEVEK